MFQVSLTSSAEKDFKKLIKKNKEIQELIFEKFSELSNLDIVSSLKSDEVKIITGLSPQFALKLKQSGYMPNVYEYRKFPSKYPLRIIFIASNNQIIILWINHHKEMKRKFLEDITNRINRAL